MKQIKYNLLIFLALFSISVSQTKAQVTIGSNDAPDKSAVLELRSVDKGLLLPRVELVSPNLPDPLLTHVTGMEVYNTATTTDLSPGKYYNDGSQWIRVGDAQTEPWFSTVTNAGANSNADNIYQMGQVGIGDSNIDPNAQLDVASSTKGVLIPRMSSAQRDAILSPADGLTIYNINSHCFNYFDAHAGKWLSMCGNVDPAVFYLLNCSAPTGYQGTYKQGQPLDETNTYTIVVNVSDAGTYQIAAKTNNGYSFGKSGTFNEPGRYTIVMEGHGTPANEAAPGNSVLLTFNGVDITPDLTACPGGLPIIPVAPSATRVELNCGTGGPTVYGTYLKGASTGSTHYVDIPVTAVTSAGQLLIETNSTVNGLKFSSGSIDVDGTTTSIRLFAQGAPLATGTSTFQFTIPDGVGSICSFDVTTVTSLGTFKDPAKSCLAILTESPTSTDGEYWIQKSSSEPTVAVKTFCDMTNGGYTLIWSYSEKTSYSVYGSPGEMYYGSGMQLTNNNPRNPVYAEAGNISYQNYRLDLTTMRSASTGTLAPYRVRIAYDPKNMNDVWGVNNYFNATPKSNSASLLSGTTTTTESNWGVVGKLYGLVFNSDTQSYNGVRTVTGGFYTSNSTYGSHWDLYFPSANFTGIFPRIDGTTVDNYTFNPNYGAGNNSQNNTFGYFANGEYKMNHHWGKCGGAGADDYNYTIKQCTTGAVPHSFNGGEGRYLQWFVK